MPLSKQPWISFDDTTVRKSATAVPGVYELGYASNGLVVYIGSSVSSIRSRLLWHKQRKAFDNITHFRFRKTDSDVAGRTERRLYDEFVKKYGRKPRLSKIKPPRESPWTIL